MRWADPLLVSLSRHRLVAGLIALQGAATTVLLLCALAGIAERRAEMLAPSGVDEARLLAVRVSGRADAAALLGERQALAALPGVAAIARVNQLPFGYGSWSTRIGVRPGGTGGTQVAAIYAGDRDLARAFGLHVYAGRAFAADEYPAEPLHVPGFAHVAHVQLSRDLAARLFPLGDALGRTVYFDDQPLQVIGLYDALQGVDPRQRASLIVPAWFGAERNATYVLRMEAAAPPMAAIARAVAGQPDRWLGDVRTLAQMRHDWFGPVRMAMLTIAVGLALWLVGTGVGMANLADLLLQARLRQIGLHRALGASAAQVRAQLRRENLLLVGAGTAAGVLATCMLWRAWPWLAASLPAPSLATCALAAGLVLVTGQCALWPVTHQADAISPALASRRA